MHKVLALFKVLTNFEVHEFDSWLPYCVRQFAIMSIAHVWRGYEWYAHEVDTQAPFAQLYNVFEA